MKKLTRFLSLTVASAMALGMFATSAFAAGDGEALDELEQEVLVPVTYETNKTPQDAKFIVTMENMKKADVEAVNALGHIKTSAAADASTVTLKEADEFSTYETVDFTGMNTYSDTAEAPYWHRETADLDFSNITWDAPGTYAYILTQEVASDPATHGITVDDSEFLYAATVARNAAGEYVLTGVVAYRITRGAGGTITALQKVTEPDDDDEAKTENDTSEPGTFQFLNIALNTDLIITNHISGTGVTDDDYCEYHITIPEGGDRLTLTKNQTFDYEITDEDGKVVKSGKVYVDDDKSNTNNDFQLKDGETITIKDLPVGMIFEVEQKTTGYTTTSDYTGTPSDGTTGPSISSSRPGTQYTIGSTSNSNAYTVDGDNVGNFYNTKDVDAPTGISVDVIPYVLVLMAAACCAVLFVSKKRSTVR
jgi:hypothetical protein